MSGMRNRRGVTGTVENTDLYSSSVIFGNVGGGPATQQQSSSTSSFSSGAPYLLDGSGGSRRSPGAAGVSFRQSPGVNHTEQYPRGNQNPPSGESRTVRNARPPITSLLEKQSRGGSALGRPMDFDSHRSPHPSAMDRTHVSMTMSAGNTSFQSEGGMGSLGDGNQSFGAYSGGFNVDSGGGRGYQGRMQTPHVGRNRLGYDDHDEILEESQRSRASTAVTPLWGREGVTASGGRSGDMAQFRSGGSYPSSGRDRDQDRDVSSALSGSTYGQQSNRMMFGDWRGGDGQDAAGGQVEAFNQLEAAWLMWVVVSGLPLGSAHTPSPSSGSSVSKVLMRMQDFGRVLEHSVSTGNWMFVKFSTPFEAERAAAEPVTFLGTGLDSHVMLSCTQLRPSLARSLNLHMDSSGALSQGPGAGTGTGVTTSPFPSSRYTESQSRPESALVAGLGLRGTLSAREDAGGAEQYLRPPKKRAGNICSRLIEYIFSY